MINVPIGQTKSIISNPVDDGHLSDDYLTKTSTSNERRILLDLLPVQHRRSIDRIAPSDPPCCQLEQKLYSEHYIGRRGNLHAKQLCQKRIEWSDEGRRTRRGKNVCKGRSGTTQTARIQISVIFISPGIRLFNSGIFLFYKIV